MPSASRVLAINLGSSSVKFALYERGETLCRELHGSLSRAGRNGSAITFQQAGGPGRSEDAPGGMDHREAADHVLSFMENQGLLDHVVGVGHRVVLGPGHSEAALVTPELIQELRVLSPCAPEHLPGEIACMEAFRKRLPGAPQIACFDTAFHSRMPAVARWLPIPRRYQALGVQRFGYHGLSYAHMMEELGSLSETPGRVILAHLGNGASLCAVRDGVSVDTSMGLTPASGLVMGTRTGDVDPGLYAWLRRTEGMSPESFLHMVNHESGLLGLSETSSDMRELLALEAHDPRAADAIALFCYQARKWIGSFAAVLGGLDTLVFSGGVGENCPSIRSRICEGLGFLGLELSEGRNAGNGPLISKDCARVATRVIQADEERIIARSVCRHLDQAAGPNGV